MDNDYGVEVFLEAQERADQNDPRGRPIEHGGKEWTEKQIETLVTDITSCAILANKIRHEGIRELDMVDFEYLGNSIEILKQMANHIDCYVGLDKKLKQE